MAELTKEQLISALCSRIDFAKQMLRGNKLALAAKRHWEVELPLSEIALAALTAEPEVWEIENPGEGTFYSAHPPRDFEKSQCVYYRLPLLEGLK